MSDSPKQGSKNVVLPPGFSERLRVLREERNLSKTDLADLAHTTYRTVHNLETDSRERAQEKTLMGIAEALGLNFSELMQNGSAANGGMADTEPAARGGVRAVWLVPLLLATLAAAAWVTWDTATSRAKWTLDSDYLLAYDGLFGLELWRLPATTGISFCVPAAWDSELLLVGLGSLAPGGGRLVALERATGRQVWATEPDIAQLTRALGENMVGPALMSCRAVDFLDIDGDGELEIFASFNHGLNHPTALCLVDRNGDLRAQYAHKGHLLRTIAADFDHDGKDEALAAGVNNAPAYGGPTLVMLDDRHWRGASVDSLCNPWSSEPDSCAIRVAIPAFPAAFHGLMGDTRLTISALSLVPQSDGRIWIGATVRGFEPRAEIWVQFDDQLRIIKAATKDNFLHVIATEWPDSLKNGTGPGDPAWLDAWLARASYFGAGRRDQAVAAR